MGRVIIQPITAQSMSEAMARGEAIINAPTAVMQARITALANDLFLSIIFRDGTRLAIPIERIPEIAELPQAVLETIEVGGFRDSIHISSADVDIYIPGLIASLYGQVVASHTGRAGGSAKTQRKAASSRENGRKGGRPRTKNKPN